MSKLLWDMVDVVAMEKDLDESVVVAALERAMAVVCRRGLEEGARVRCQIQADGEFRAWRSWEVADDDARLVNPGAQLRRMDLGLISEAVDAGNGVVEQPIPTPPLTRVVARQLYQHLVQEVRLAQRQAAHDAWRNRLGTMVTGTVKHVAGGMIFVDVEGAQARLSASEALAGERLKVGARVRLVVTALNEDGRGPALVGSRRTEALLEQLLALEVPEIRNGLVEIKAVARDSTGRAKIAVHALDRRVDAVGACVGMRGTRIQSISQELSGERIDLVEWDQDPATFVVRALAPAAVSQLVIDESRRVMDVGVPGDGVGLALGRAGQNVRLASRLTGWDLRVWDEDALREHSANSLAAAQDRLIRALDTDEELAGFLVEGGFEDVAVLAGIDPAELVGLGLSDDTAREIVSRAGLAFALADEADEAPNEADAWGSLSHELRSHLEAVGVDSNQALAEACVDDLAGIPILDARAASELILLARKPWLEALEAQASD